MIYDATNTRKNKTLLLGRKNGVKYQLLESQQVGIGFDGRIGHLGQVKIKSKNAFLFLPQYIALPFPSKKWQVSCLM